MCAIWCCTCLVALIQRSSPSEKKERKKSYSWAHFFVSFFQGLHFNHSNRRLLNVLIYYIFNFTFWWQIGHPRNAPTRPRGCAQDENAFPMSHHDRMRALGCHCGLELTARFTTCNSVTSSGTLDTLHFVGGEVTAFSLSRTRTSSSRWRRRAAHRVAGLSITSNKRNESIVKRRNRASHAKNIHKEARTGKSSVFTSWEIITPFWMCLWGQRGLRCDCACTMSQWGRGSWSECRTLRERRRAWCDNARLSPANHVRFVQSHRSRWN